MREKLACGVGHSRSDPDIQILIRPRVVVWPMNTMT